jgi:hypothetical protein
MLVLSMQTPGASVVKVPVLNPSSSQVFKVNGPSASHEAQRLQSFVTVTAGEVQVARQV